MEDEEAEAASMSMVMYGSIEKGQLLYHDVYLHEDVRYEIDLEAENEKTDLDLYITDVESTILYEDEDADSGASAWFEPGESGIYSFYVKLASGPATDYTITVQEQ